MILYKNKKLVIPAGLSPNINHQSVEIKNQNKYVSITENGTEIVTFDPENYTGLGIVQINTEVAAASIQPPVTVELTDNGRYSVTPQEGYVGLGEVDVRVDVQPKLQVKVVDSSTNSQVILPDETYAGMAQISINPYHLDEKTVDSSTRLQVITSDVNGLSQVTINPYILNSLELNSSTGSQELRGQFGTVIVNPYTLDSSSAVIDRNGNYSFESTADGLSRVDVSVNIDTSTYYNEGYVAGETAGIAEGIAEQKALLDSSTFTSNGTYTRENGWNEVTVNVSTVNNQALTLDASTNQRVLTPSAPYTGFSPVTVNAVTAAIDSNIVAGNIKKDVSILGVTGTYEGSGTNTPGSPYIETDGNGFLYLGINGVEGQPSNDVEICCTFKIGSGGTYSAFNAANANTTTKGLVGYAGANNNSAFGIGFGRTAAGTGADTLYWFSGDNASGQAVRYSHFITTTIKLKTSAWLFDRDDDDFRVNYLSSDYSLIQTSTSWTSAGTVTGCGDWAIFVWDDEDDIHGIAPAGTRLYELHIITNLTRYDFYPVYINGQAGLAKYTNGTFTANILDNTNHISYGVEI